MKLNRLKITGIIISSVILSIMMQSCGTIQKYASPKIDTENLIRHNSSVGLTDTLTIADIPWQEYFSDSLTSTINSRRSGAKSGFTNSRNTDRASRSKFKHGACSLFPFG
jgi:hypothetical protein